MWKYIKYFLLFCLALFLFLEASYVLAGIALIISIILAFKLYKISKHNKQDPANKISYQIKPLSFIGKENTFDIRLILTASVLSFAICLLAGDLWATHNREEALRKQQEAEQQAMQLQLEEKAKQEEIARQEELKKEEAKQAELAEQARQEEQKEEEAQKQEMVKKNKEEAFGIFVFDNYLKENTFIKPKLFRGSYNVATQKYNDKHTAYIVTYSDKDNKRIKLIFDYTGDIEATDEDSFKALENVDYWYYLENGNEIYDELKEKREKAINDQ